MSAFTLPRFAPASYEGPAILRVGYRESSRNFAEYAGFFKPDPVPEPELPTGREYPFPVSRAPESSFVSLVTLSQAEFDALVVKDPNTVYVVEA